LHGRHLAAEHAATFPLGWAVPRDGTHVSSRDASR
jgi:hypothetical protein